MTLFEVLIAGAVGVMLIGGLLASLIQSRRLTEGSIYQNSANTLMQGYVEQIKNMQFAELPCLNSGGTISAGLVVGHPGRLMTRSIVRVTAGGATENQSDPLDISTATTIPAPSAILESTLPTGVVDNVKTFDINQTPDNPNDDLRLRIWLWINDVSDASADATRVRAITMIYSWRPTGAAQARSFVGTVRTIRSSVPTF